MCMPECSLLNLPFKNYYFFTFELHQNLKIKKQRKKKEIMEQKDWVLEKKRRKEEGRKEIWVKKKRKKKI